MWRICANLIMSRFPVRFCFLDFFFLLPKWICQCLFNKIFSYNISRLCQQLKCQATAFPAALHHAAILTLTPFAVKINARWKKHWSWDACEFKAYRDMQTKHTVRKKHLFSASVFSCSNLKHVMFAAFYCLLCALPAFLLHALLKTKVYDSLKNL